LSAVRSRCDALSNLFLGSAPPATVGPPPVLHAEASAAARSTVPSPSIAQPLASNAPVTRAPSLPGEVQKLRNEILRLELLVKRLQAELVAGREYCSALEAHFKRLQESDSI
jgi:hypothetical protein